MSLKSFLRLIDWRNERRDWSEDELEFDAVRRGYVTREDLETYKADNEVTQQRMKRHKNGFLA